MQEWQRRARQRTKRMPGGSDRLRRSGGQRGEPVDTDRFVGQ
ncbi:hypothetical protein [Cryobacterium sp. PH31-L1]|nr:hypothetical protein [Cryobacterium sp. PH31-L1]MDJ0376292.1 hypothetical protein [Cryobacterium sp. PH31-L1]